MIIKKNKGTNSLFLKNFTNNYEKGITLIEMIATVSIFAIVVTIAVGALITIIKTQRKNNAQRTIQQEAKNITETIIREAKFVSGSNSYPPFTVGNKGDSRDDSYTWGNQITLTNGSDIKTYFLDNSLGYGTVKVVENSDPPDLNNAHNITSENVNITELKFEISPKSVPVAPATKPKVQPFVNMTVALESRKDTAETRSQTTLTTTFSSLKYYYPQGTNIPIPREPSDGLEEPSNGLAKACQVDDFNDINYLEQISDGGYILGGDVSAFSDDKNRILLIKTDSNLDTGPSYPETWVKSFKNNNVNIFFSSLQQTSDGGYILGGDFGITSPDLLIIKTDSGGNKVWAKTYGGGGGDYLTHFQQTSDGGYILGGYTSSFGGGYHGILIKTDSNGNVGAAYPDTWAKTYGGTNWNIITHFQQTSDGGYILLGDTNFGAGEEDLFLIKTDNLGNFEWMKTYGGLDYDYSEYVMQTSDGGYILGGPVESFGQGGWDLLIIKTDSNGNVGAAYPNTWIKSYGGSSQDCVFDIKQNPDGNYLLGGSTGSFGGLLEGLFVKTDSNGNVGAAYPNTWAKTYGGNGLDLIYSFKKTSNGYILGGITTSFGSGIAGNSLFMKTDFSGNINNCSIVKDITLNPENINLTPNNIDITPNNITLTPQDITSAIAQQNHTINCVSICPE